MYDTICDKINQVKIIWFRFKLQCCIDTIGYRYIIKSEIQTKIRYIRLIFYGV